MTSRITNGAYGESSFGGLTAEEVRSRGRSRKPFTNAEVNTALDRVRKSRVLGLLAAWREQDHPSHGVGGRPALIPDQAILVGWMLLAHEHTSLHVRSLSEVFQYRLSPEARAVLGIPAPSRASAQQHLERNRWEKNTHNAFHRILTLMEPYPISRRRTKTYQEVQQLLEERDLTHERAMKERLDEFTNTFLLMTFNEQPRRLRRAGKQQLDISFDQTYIEAPTQKSVAPKNLAKRVEHEKRAQSQNRALIAGPVDPFAGWYPITGDRPDIPRGETDTTGPGKGSDKSMAWGWAANIAVRVDSEELTRDRFPKLAVAATVSIPNVGKSEEAVSLMRAAARTGLKPGIADADMDYFANAVVERLHKPTLEIGFTPSTEYRVDRLGVRGGKAGVEYIEGEKYCPGMPQALKNATIDYRTGTIDRETLRARHDGRKAFLIRPKEKPDHRGNTPMMCPALGNSPTVTCPLRELAKMATNKVRPAVDTDDLPDFLDKICKQHSVTFTQEDDLRNKQAFTYMSDEWETFHEYARNSIESLNAAAKDSHREAMEDASRRRVRGLAAAQFFVTVLLVNYNIRKIADFLYREELEANASVPAGSGNRRRDDAWYNPYTGTTPPGKEPPLPKSQAAESPPLRT